MNVGTLRELLSLLPDDDGVVTRGRDHSYNAVVHVGTAEAEQWRFSGHLTEHDPDAPLETGSKLVDVVVID